MRTAYLRFRNTHKPSKEKVMLEIFYWPNGDWCTREGDEETPEAERIALNGDDWRLGRLSGRCGFDDIELWIHNKLQAFKAAEKRKKYGQT